MLRKLCATCLGVLLLALCLTSCHSNGETSAPETLPTATTTTVTTDTTQSMTTSVTTCTTTGSAGKVQTTVTTTSKTVSTTATTSKPTTTTTGVPDMYTVKNVIADAEFYDGFNVMSQKDHANGDRVTQLGTFFYTHSLKDPSWGLYQYDCGPCLWADRIKSDKNTLTDGVSKWVTYNPKEKSLLLRLNSEAYYQGKGAVQGDYWPTLLIGQEETMDYLTAPQDEKIFYTAEADRWELSFDVRMPVFEQTFNPDDWVEATQVVMYFYIVPKNTHKFVWFGAQVFDNRWEHTQNYYIIDGGKDDASGLPIYVIPTDDVYANSERSLWVDGKPQADDTWIHVSIDLLPHLDKMREIAIKNGYFDAGTKLEDLFLHGMNFGWETIGTFDNAIEIKNLQLNSYVDKALL